MKTTRNVLACLAAAALAACSSSNDNGNPAKPALGAQIDRMGRAAVNTALTNPFGLNGLTTGQSTDASKDAYNAAADPAAWVATWATPIAKNLAILDSLDANCGNQLLAKTGATVPADRYAPLAGILADDRLYVRTDKTTCSAYLAVEATAAGVAGFDQDCGGRTPTEDTIDESYSLFAIGAPSGVTDGIGADGDNPPGLSAFPFLGVPNP